MKAGKTLLALTLSFALTGCMSEAETGTLRNAALYAYGPYQYALNVERLRQRHAEGGIGLNAVAHTRTVADHTARDVTTPNADTIYSSAVLDLSGGPVELILPETEGRYVSVMIMDIFTDVTATVGTGRDGVTGGHYWITGPDWAGEVPEGVTQIAAPGPDSWLLARIFVAGPNDLDAAHSVQSQIIVHPLSEDIIHSGPTIPTETPNAEQMLSVVNTLLGRAPDHPHVDRATAFTELGLRPGDAKAWDNLSFMQRQRWRIAFDRMQTGLKSALSERGDTQGWQRTPANLARFGADDATRAAVSLVGFGALQAEEATYFSATRDGDGQPLTGAQDYTLTLDPDAVPVDAFWSLSLYEIQADGRRFFIDNPLGRNAINSATPGLVRDPAGRLPLQIASTRPDADADINWMPAPDGEFALVFRTYLPREPILSGDWTPPDILRHADKT